MKHKAAVPIFRLSAAMHLGRKSSSQQAVLVLHHLTQGEGEAVSLLAMRQMADGGGFEPPVPLGTHALQACTIDRSVTHPNYDSRYFPRIAHTSRRRK